MSYLTVKTLQVVGGVSKGAMSYLTVKTLQVVGGVSKGAMSSTAKTLQVAVEAIVWS